MPQSYDPMKFYNAVLQNASVRPAYPSEDEFFKSNQNIGGYAADDGMVVVNPYSPLNDQEKNAIKVNETIRQALRAVPVDNRPSFDLTADQSTRFKNYSPNTRDVQDTILARILTGDPSAGAISEQQKTAAGLAAPLILNYLGVQPNGIITQLLNTKGE